MARKRSVSPEPFQALIDDESERAARNRAANAAIQRRQDFLASKAIFNDALYKKRDAKSICDAARTLKLNSNEAEFWLDYFECSQTRFGSIIRKHDPAILAGVEVVRLAFAGNEKKLRACLESISLGIFDSRIAPVISNLLEWLESGSFGDNIIPMPLMSRAELARSDGVARSTITRRLLKPDALVQKTVRGPYCQFMHCDATEHLAMLRRAVKYLMSCNRAKNTIKKPK